MWARQFWLECFLMCHFTRSVVLYGNPFWQAISPHLQLEKVRSQQLCTCTSICCCTSTINTFKVNEWLAVKFKCEVNLKWRSVKHASYYLLHTSVGTLSTSQQKLKGATEDGAGSCLLKCLKARSLSLMPAVQPVYSDSIRLPHPESEHWPVFVYDWQWLCKVFKDDPGDTRAEPVGANALLLSYRPSSLSHNSRWKPFLSHFASASLALIWLLDMVDTVLWDVHMWKLSRNLHLTPFKWELA